MKHEQFKKLEQSDRIEYILRNNLIKDDYGFILFNLCTVLFTILMLFTILALLSFIAFGNKPLIDISSITFLFNIFLFFGASHDIFVYFLRKKEFKKLDKYFLYTRR